MHTRPISLATLIALLATLLVGLAGPAHAQDRDCGDFDNQAQAQRFYNNAGPGDPHQLDSDDDGRACETLPCPCGTGGGGGGGSTGGGGGGDSVLRQKARVIRVIDGDTYKARIGTRRVDVRMIGIDTPELRGDECGSLRAKQALKRMLPRRSRVVLTSDPSQDRTDRYGRLLRYTAKGGRDINRAQVYLGWARVYVYDNTPFRRVDTYRRAQRDADRANRGIWDLCRR